MREPWPYTTVEQLSKAGYTFARASRCSGIHKGGTCNLPIHFYNTPEGREIPLNPQTLMPHHATCTDVALFRKPRATTPKQTR